MEHPSVVEAMSWRLASELERRHPDELRLHLMHPGGGQYDVLALVDPKFERRYIMLNRAGTIQVHEIYSGAGASVPAREWRATDWEMYQSADPVEFLEALENAAGFPRPKHTPMSVPRTISHRVIAAIMASGIQAARRVTCAMGYFDASGMGGGPNADLEAFGIPRATLERRESDPMGEAGFRFWIISRAGQPIVAIDHDASLAWHHLSEAPTDLTKLYRTNKSIQLTAATLFAAATA